MTGTTLHSITAPLAWRSVALSRWQKALGALALLYLAQLASPLRLNTDAVTLLAIARSVVAGAGFTLHGHATHYPPGYPALVAGLDRMGIANAATLVLLNMAFLALGLCATYRLAHRRFKLSVNKSLAVVAVTLLNYVVVKHVTLPLSDMPFFGLSLAALVTIRERRWWLAVPLLVAACAMRTIGVALVPSLLWALVGRRLSRRALIAGAGITLIAAVAIGQRYLHEAVDTYRSLGAFFPLVLVRYRLTEIGEIVANLPAARVPWFVLAPVALITITLLVAIFWHRRHRLGVVDVYVLAYAAILAVWPYYDARFWMPLVPLFAIYLVRALHLIRQERFFLRLSWRWYVLTGALALTYSTVLSLAPRRMFAQRYSPAYAAVYRSAFDGTPLVTSDSSIADAAQLVRHFR